MRSVFKAIIVLILLCVLSFSMISVSAADYGCNIATVSSAIYMENLNTGTVVYEKNITEKLPPASLTKMMTYIIVAESVSDLENTMVTVSEESLIDLDPESSVMGLADYIGEEFSVLELLYGLMLPSGNDAALVLADYVGDGDVDAFVEKMNRKAGQLGCKNTHFVNPHGLYDPEHYSTAKDLAVITKYAYEKPYFTQVTSSHQYDVEKMDEPIKTTNYMIDPEYSQYYYSYTEGGKTGYTDEAGKCLVTTAKKDDYHYLCIAVGAPYTYEEDINYAMLDSKDMYEWAFDNISFIELLPAQEVVEDLPVEFVWGDEYVDIIADGAVTALLPNDYDKALVTTKVDLPQYVSAPIEQGQEFGSICVYYNDELVGTSKLISSESIERDQSNYLMHCFIDFVVNNIGWVVVVLAVVILLVIVNVSARRRQKKLRERYRYR